MSNKQNDEILEKLKEEHEDIRRKIETFVAVPANPEALIEKIKAVTNDIEDEVKTEPPEDLQKALTNKQYLREYEYVALVRCPISGEVLAEVSTNNFEIFEQKIYQLKKVVDKDARQIEKDLDEWYVK